MLRTPGASVSRSTPAPAGWSGPGSDAGVNRGTQACRGAPDSGKIMEDLASVEDPVPQGVPFSPLKPDLPDRKSTRLNSSHANISYAVFCLKKKTSSVSPAA